MPANLLGRQAETPALLIENMITHITAVILAGGKSSRMGSDKALLPFEGRPLMEHVFGTLTEIFQRVTLSVNRADAYLPWNAPRVLDRYPEIGPLGGIMSVLETGVPRIFCVACDMPFLNRALIEYVCSFVEYDAVIPQWQGRAQVLHAMYSSGLLSVFQTAIQQGNYKITDAIVNSRNIKLIDDAELQPFNPAQAFQNINTPQDYEDLNH